MATPAPRARSCPTCSGHLASGPYDLCVIDDGGERHFFGIPAAVCRACGTIQLEVDVLRLYRIDPDRVSGAIGSDSCLRELDWTDAA